MKNHKRLILTCPYDLMMKVAERAGMCPIVLFSGFIPDKYNIKCEIPSDCEECVQKWLNEEETTYRRKRK